MGLLAARGGQKSGGLMSRRQPRLGERREDVFCEAAAAVRAHAVVSVDRAAWRIKPAKGMPGVVGVALRAMRQGARGWIRVYGWWR